MARANGAGISVQRPWLALGALLVGAMLATWLIVAQAREQIEKNEGALRTRAGLQLDRIDGRLGRFFESAVQLATAGAQIFGGVHDDLPLAQRLTKGLFEGRGNPAIYGLGPFYAPGGFGARFGLLGIYYERAADGSAMSYVTTAGVYWSTDARGRVRYFKTIGRQADYTRQPWYRAARGSRRVAVVGPYTEDGKSFVSVVRGFYRGPRFAGVFSVDALTARFLRLLAVAPGSHAIAFVSSHSGAVVLRSSVLPAHRSGWLELVRSIPYTRARLHVLVDAAATRAADARIVSSGTVLALALWSLAALFAVVLWRDAAARARTTALELARTRLERQLAIGQEVEGELRRIAHTDSLTGLPNRSAFLERTATLLARDEGEPRGAVFFVDLDRFNLINDTLGHLAGDELLKSIAVRLRDALPPDATVYRLGGDEFVIVCEGSMPPAQIAAAVLGALAKPMLLGGRVIYTGASLGVVEIAGEYRAPEELLRDADIAMYAAKERGRGQFVTFDATMRNRVAAESQTETDLRRGLERDEFVPYYQPVVEIASGALASFEALARWDRPGHGIVAARDFIPYAERRGLIDAIDDRMLRRACFDASTIAERFPETPVAVNVSARRLCWGDLVAHVGATLAAASLPPAALRLEITETTVMTDPDQARTNLERLRDAGIAIVLDDFGAGYSSLAYLHRLPISGVKIDGSFISSIASDRHAEAIVRSIVALADRLGLYTVAEGVETAEQLRAVESLGVQFAQGFFFSPALPLRALRAPLPFARGLA